jgi:hypothetical protein
MKVSDYIATNIDRLPNGHDFTFADFDVEVNKKEVALKSLYNMVASIKKDYLKWICGLPMLVKKLCCQNLKCARLMGDSNNDI